VEADGGPIDVLANNAGIETLDLIEEMDEDEILNAVLLNLVAPERLTRQVLSGMFARDKGHIVYTSSAAAMTPSPGASVYCSTKAGLTRFSEVVRLEAKKTDVNVTTLHLGPVDTAMWGRIANGPAFDAAQARIRKFGLLTDVSPEKVAEDTVAAVQKGKREVRHPKRLGMTMSIASTPGPMTEALLAGIDFRKHRKSQLASHHLGVWSQRPREHARGHDDACHHRECCP
jgi:short-subunit dehydrogenase